jgi:hypothetical protein
MLKKTRAIIQTLVSQYYTLSSRFPVNLKNKNRDITDVSVNIVEYAAAFP